MPLLQDRPVLVVDDDDDLRETILELLREERFEVHSASNGREALPVLQQLRSRRPILLLDIVMPRLDGLTLLEHLRQHGRDLQPTVIVMTASHLRPPPEYMLLRKPFSAQEFLAAAEQATRIGGAPMGASSPSEPPRNPGVSKLSS